MEIILSMLLGIFIITISMKFVIINVKKILLINKINKTRQIQLEIQKKLVSDMKAKGENHEWMTMERTINGELHNIHVCKKTGWCPKINGFFVLDYVKNELRKQEMESKYKVFRDRAVGDLAKKYNVSLAEMEKIVEDVFDIKKQFHLQYIDNGGN